MSVTVNEKSSFCIELRLLDRDGNPLVPVDELSWWVGRQDCDDPVWPRQEIVPPSNDELIPIPADANICEGCQDEQRFVIIRAVSGIFTKHIAINYKVKALRTVPYPT
jgi:hypothetical protein